MHAFLELVSPVAYRIDPEQAFLFRMSSGSSKGMTT